MDGAWNPMHPSLPGRGLAGPARDSARSAGFAWLAPSPGYGAACAGALMTVTPGSLRGGRARPGPPLAHP